MSNTSFSELKLKKDILDNKKVATIFVIKAFMLHSFAFYLSTIWLKLSKKIKSRAFNLLDTDDHCDAPCRTRTYDQVIKSHLLYQLS